MMRYHQKKSTGIFSRPEPGIDQSSKRAEEQFGFLSDPKKLLPCCNTLCKNNK